jgi:hypothetical protein
MMADVFMFYEADESDEGEKIVIWTSAELFRPGDPGCARFSLHEDFPLEEIVITGIGAFVRERMIRCQAAIDAAS